MTFDLATAIANHAAYFHAPQTVTLRMPNGSSATVANVTTEPLSDRQMAMVGNGITTEDATQSFSLPTNQLGGLVPTQSATITDAAGVVWAILSADIKTIDTRYSCACVKKHDADSAPFQPINLANDSSSGGTLRLTWTNRNAVDTGVSGEVNYSTSAGFGSSTTLTVSSISGASISYSHSIAAGTYYVRVRHINAKGNSPYSDIVQITVS